MLRNPLFTPNEKRQAAISVNGPGDNPPLQGNSETNIDDLFHHLRSGLWGLLVFLAASAVALYFKEHSLASSLPAEIMDQLGSTPPIILINCVFGASTLSSLISIFGRIYHNREPGNTSTHLWFRVFFYLLYFISGALNDYFNVVFISGLVVLALQHYNVWNFYTRAIEIKLNKLESCGR